MKTTKLHRFNRTVDMSGPDYSAYTGNGSIPLYSYREIVVK